MEWQPIETAPKDGRYVIIGAANILPTIAKWREDKGRVLIASDEPYWEPYDDSHWDRFDIDDTWFEPTHWTDLPEPPKP